jgi:hypothetical protein
MDMPVFEIQKVDLETVMVNARTMQSYIRMEVELGRLQVHAIDGGSTGQVLIEASLKNLSDYRGHINIDADRCLKFLRHATGLMAQVGFRDRHDGKRHPVVQVNRQIFHDCPMRHEKYMDVNPVKFNLFDASFHITTKAMLEIMDLGYESPSVRFKIDAHEDVWIIIPMEQSEYIFHAGKSRIGKDVWASYSADIMRPIFQSLMDGNKVFSDKYATINFSKDHPCSIEWVRKRDKSQVEIKYLVGNTLEIWG